MRFTRPVTAIVACVLVVAFLGTSACKQFLFPNSRFVNYRIEQDMPAGQAIELWCFVVAVELVIFAMIIEILSHDIQSGSTSPGAGAAAPFPRKVKINVTRESAGGNATDKLVSFTLKYDKNTGVGKPKKLNVPEMPLNTGDTVRVTANFKGATVSKGSFIGYFATFTPAATSMQMGMGSVVSVTRPVLRPVSQPPLLLSPRDVERGTVDPRGAVNSQTVIEPSVAIPAHTPIMESAMNALQDALLVGDRELIRRAQQAHEAIDEIELLMDDVDDLARQRKLQKVHADALKGLLEQALDQVDPGNDIARMIPLLGFINLVNDYGRSGALRSEEGRGLIEDARYVVDEILTDAS